VQRFQKLRKKISFFYLFDYGSLESCPSGFHAVPYSPFRHYKHLVLALYFDSCSWETCVRSFVILIVIRSSTFLHGGHPHYSFISVHTPQTLSHPPSEFLIRIQLCFIRHKPLQRHRSLIFITCASYTTPCSQHRAFTTLRFVSLRSVGHTTLIHRKRLHQLTLSLSTTASTAYVPFHSCLCNLILIQHNISLASQNHPLLPGMTYYPLFTSISFILS